VVDYGRDRQSGQWRCPAREQWGLGPHQKMTPELEDRICLTATLTGSYEAAAAMAAKWAALWMTRPSGYMRGGSASERSNRCKHGWLPAVRECRPPANFQRPPDWWS